MLLPEKQEAALLNLIKPKDGWIFFLIYMKDKLEVGWNLLLIFCYLP